MLLWKLNAGGSDFTGISGRHLTFGPDVNSMEVLVRMLNDNIFETVETFTASFAIDVPRLELMPDEVTVDILDDDCELLLLAQRHIIIILALKR